MENTQPINRLNKTFSSNENVSIGFNVFMDESYPIDLHKNITNTKISEVNFVYDEIQSIYTTAIKQGEQLFETHKIDMNIFYNLLTSYVPNRTCTVSNIWYEELNNYKKNYDSVYSSLCTQLDYKELKKAIDFICNKCWTAFRYKQLLYENADMFIQKLKKEEAESSIINFKEKFMYKFIYSYINGYSEEDLYFYKYEIKKLLNTRIGIEIYENIYYIAGNAFCIDTMIFIKIELQINPNTRLTYEKFNNILTYNISKNNLQFIQKYQYVYGYITNIDLRWRTYTYKIGLVLFIRASILSGNINLFRWVLTNQYFWNYIDTSSNNEIKPILQYQDICINTVTEVFLNLFNNDEQIKNKCGNILFEVNRKKPYDLKHQNIINDDIVNPLSDKLCKLNYSNGGSVGNFNLEILKRIFSTQTDLSLKILNRMNHIITSKETKEKIYNVAIEAGLIFINTKTIKYYPRIKWTRKNFHNMHPRFKDAIITFITISSNSSKRINTSNLKKNIILKWNQIYLPDELIFSIVQMIHPGDYNPYRSNKCTKIKKIFRIKK